MFGWLKRIRAFAKPAGGGQRFGVRFLRARYEVANNAYARGIVLTLANDVIGTGPRLQMLSEKAGFSHVVGTSHVFHLAPQRP